MSPHQLIYISRPFGYDPATLAAILITARHFNRLSEVTGALICRDDIFLQLLEGEREAVETTYRRIERDGRHVDPHVLVSGETDARQFAQWEMRHDPARSWLWTPDEVWNGAPLKATASDIRAIFTRIAAEPYEESGAVM